MCSSGFTAGEPYLLVNPFRERNCADVPDGTSRQGGIRACRGDGPASCLATGTEGEKGAGGEDRTSRRLPGSQRFRDDDGWRACTPGRGATLSLTNNTSTMHIADACGTPSVVLYSGTELESQWRPRNAPHRLLRRAVPCSPCYAFTCPSGLECLDVPPEEVVRAGLELLPTAAYAPSISFRGDGGFLSGGRVCPSTASIASSLSGRELVPVAAD